MKEKDVRTMKPTAHDASIKRGTPPLAAAVLEHPVVAEVLAGKRYVTYPYVVSVLVLTFRRSLGDARLVATNQWPMGPLFFATILTMTFGWWGFPWGLVKTPLALLDLWKGGHDYTREMLSVIAGAPEAKRILSIAPQPKPPTAIWLVRSVILMPLLGLGVWLFETIFP